MVDWPTVDRLLHRLAMDVESGECPHFVYLFISDSDIRAKDQIYGDQQRKEVRRFVATGEYEDSKEVSPYGCWFMAVLCGLAIWLS